MKKILSFIAAGVIGFALFLYLFAPILECYGETINVIDVFDDSATPMIVFTVLFMIACLIGAIVFGRTNNNVVGFVFGGISVLTAIFCFCAKEFIITDYGLESMSDYFELGGGAVLSGILMFIGAGLLFGSAIIKQGVFTMNSTPTPNNYNTPNNSAPLSQEEKQNNLVRFLLTFFLGWIGSLIINHSTLKPRGFTSRTLAYLFLSMITFGIYGLVASICNLDFNPAHATNVGYFRDGTDAYAPTPTPFEEMSTSQTYTPNQTATPVQTYTEQKPQGDFSKQFEEMQMLKKLLDDGIITQEDFDVKKKEILGL